MIWNFQNIAVTSTCVYAIYQVRKKQNMKDDTYIESEEYTARYL